MWNCEILYRVEEGEAGGEEKEHFDQSDLMAKTQNVFLNSAF